MSSYRITFRTFLPVLLATLVGAATLSVPSSSLAAFKVRISTDGGATFTTVEDQKAGDLAPVKGILTMFYSDSVVAVTIATGQSKPLFGNNAYNAAMDIAVSGTFAKAGSLIVDITDTDFMPPTSPSGKGILTAEIASNSLGTGSGVTFKGYLNGDDPGTVGPQGNTEFGGIDPTTGTLLVTGTASAPLPVNNTKKQVFGTAYDPYSLSARTVITGAGAGTGFSVDNALHFATPAPAGVVLALTGLPVLGLGAWLRRRRNSTAK